MKHFKNPRKSPLMKNKNLVMAGEYGTVLIKSLVIMMYYVSVDPDPPFCLEDPDWDHTKIQMFFSTSCLLPLKKGRRLTEESQ
jgi:hypothetical protein